MKSTNNKGRSSGKSATPSTTTNKKYTGNSADAQRARLLAALEAGPVTTLDARRDLDILMPAVHVHALRHRFGKAIDTVKVSRQTEAGNSHMVALYVLLPDAQFDLFEGPARGEA